MEPNPRPTPVPRHANRNRAGPRLLLTLGQVPVSHDLATALSVPKHVILRQEPVQLRPGSLCNQISRSLTKELRQRVPYLWLSN